MFNRKKRSLKCKTNLEEEKICIDWPKIDYQMAKSRSNKKIN